MTPIDDELRALLHSRADAVPPAPDPLSGIERRAKHMRRNQVAASVVGAALAVAAVAVAVPALMPDRDGDAGVFATTPPSPEASPSPTTRTFGPNEANPARPWAYRGSDEVLANGNLAELRREWVRRHPDTVLDPIFGQTYQPSQQAEIVFVSYRSVHDGDRWGVATTSESGIEILVDEPLPTPSTALMAALPGDEAPRLLILAAPSTGDISYAKDGSAFRSLPGVEPGVAFVALEGDTSSDRVRVLDGNGDIDRPLFLGPAPDYGGATSGDVSGVKPANYLGWQTRGSVDARTEAQAVSAFAQSKASTEDRVRHHVLWGGTDKSGRKLVFMEAWVDGGSAQTFGFVSTGEPFLGPAIAKDPDVLAYLASGAPGTGTDVLVILPRIGAGSFSYAASATAPYRHAGNVRSDFENYAVIDRDPKATSDRVKVLDGDGMKVLYDGPVQPLLCGASECG